MGDISCFIDLENSLVSVEDHVKVLLENESIDKLIEDMPNLEKAKVHIATAYSINALFYVYLKSLGVDPNNHPVKKELNRIRTYIEKLKKSQILEKGRSLKLDVAASQRFINNALSTDQVYVEALKVSKTSEDKGLDSKKENIEQTAVSTHIATKKLKRKRKR